MSVESLRNSADVITSHISRWVFSVLQFVDDRPAQWKEQQRQLWQALDVDPEIIELMVEGLELCWTGSHLCVRGGAEVVMYGVCFGGQSKKVTVFCVFAVCAHGSMHSAACVQGWRQRCRADSIILFACLLAVQEVDGKQMADHRLSQSCFGRSSSARFGCLFKILEAGQGRCGGEWRCSFCG